MRGEWKPFDILNSRVFTPRLLSSSNRRLSSSRSPVRTVFDGPFIAAIDTPGRAPDQSAQVGFRSPDRGHCAAGWHLVHQGAARDSEPHRVLKRQHAGNARGGDFAKAMADQRARRDAPPLQNSVSAYSTASSAGWV